MEYMALPSKAEERKHFHSDSGVGNAIFGERSLPFESRADRRFTSTKTVP